MSNDYAEPCDQDVLIMEYMGALLHRDVDSECFELQTSSVKRGFEVVPTIDLGSIMSGQKKLTRYEAMMILLTNIQLITRGDLTGRLASSILVVSRRMSVELSAR